MWKLVNVFLVLAVAGVGLTVPKPLLASWAQVDEATKDAEVKKLTNEGSKAFLDGVIKVQDAMAKLDAGNRKDAAVVGLKAADDFDQARKKFEAARDALKARKDIHDELAKYLRGVNYAAKAAALGVVPERAPLWVSLQKVAVDPAGGPVMLFDSAAGRAKLLRDRSSAFFTAVAAADYRPIVGSALLGQIGADIAFGAYVSAVFTKE